MDEQWRDVVGYENLYQVSSDGRIRSKRIKTRIVDKKDNIMRQKLDDKGYLRINLHDKNGKCKAELVSRIVANAFIPNPNNLPHVGHNDDNKTHNTIDNLYWTNPAENNRHNGKLDKFHRAHNKKIDIIADKLSVPVTATSIDNSHEISFNSMQEAARCGFDGGKISMCVNGLRKKHKGYTWKRSK